MGTLPTKKLLANAVIQVLKQASEPMRACDINDKVAELLQIPQDVLKIEDANCTGSEFSYQMRWIRTNLKNLGVNQQSKTRRLGITKQSPKITYLTKQT